MTDKYGSVGISISGLLVLVLVSGSGKDRQRKGALTNKFNRYQFRLASTTSRISLKTITLESGLPLIVNSCLRKHIRSKLCTQFVRLRTYRDEVGATQI